MKKTSILFIRIYFIFLIILFYIGITFKANKNIFGPTPLGYYTPFIDAILHGRINLLFPHHHDLSFLRGKWYMYWGPAPVLFILPFYFAGGLFASDVTYVLFAGIANIVLFDLVLHAAKTYFNVSLSLMSELLLLFCFAFVSPNFYLSLTGSVYATEQLVGICYLFVFYFFYFNFLTKKRIGYLIIAIIFFNLAWLSRYILIFHGIMFILALNEKRQTLRNAIMVVGITSVFVTIFFIYNYAKSGNPFETGLRYHQASPRYVSAMQKNELLSFSYVYHNAYYFFFNIPHFSFHKPFIRVDPEGNSIFFVYPSIVFLIFLYSKISKLDKKNRYFLLCSGVVISITLTTLLFFFGTGWVQFGMRYFLDVVPLVYILFIFVIDDIPKYISIPVLIYGCIVQIVGTLYFYTYY